MLTNSKQDYLMTDLGLMAWVNAGYAVGEKKRQYYFIFVANLC
jgi:hypothetical protein